MKDRLLKIIGLFFCFAVLLALQKPLFAICVGGYGLSDTFAVMWHGFPMDMSVAGYFTAIPALLIVASVWHTGPWIDIAVKIYLGVISAVMSITCVSNIALYPYWNFPLDFTPLFYFTTSPQAAMASIPLWQLFLGIAAMVLLAWLYYKCLSLAWGLGHFACEPLKPIPKIWNRELATLATLIATGLLFLPIRGGVSVSTMNVGRVYFSDDMRLNHAAVNPFFSFMHSAIRQNDFSSTCHYMPDQEAAKIMDSLYPAHLLANDSLPQLGYLPDIQIIILESFSSHLLPSLGGDSIAMRLDSIGSQGWLFSNIYSTSFRTDRGVPAILDAYPALPSTSISKYTHKLDHIPALARTLRDAGYETSFYYGGDNNFSNQGALLVAGGFSSIVSDKDFNADQKQSKWGAYDHVVFQRAIDDQISRENNPSQTPRLTTILTSSSHEPFEVPFQSRHANKRVNAFAYADSCLGDYIDRLKQTQRYDSTLVVIVPDHWGVYPELTDPEQRHRIPLILTGGAIGGIEIDSALLSRIGAQTDIAATILSLIGIDHSLFRFSNNLLDPARPEFVFFSEPSWIAFKTPQGFVQYSLDTNQPMTQPNDSLLAMLKAYAQSLYSDFDSR